MTETKRTKSDPEARYAKALGTKPLVLASQLNRWYAATRKPVEYTCGG